MLQKQNSNSYNGLILSTTYIPKELLVQILLHVDHEQLLLCHLVCKQWNELIKKNVWRKKAETACGKALFIDDKIPWISYYFICNKKPFTRNLLTSDDVKVIDDDDDENNSKIIQVDVKEFDTSILSFPEDLVFRDKVKCIQILNESNVSLKRKFIIDLIKEGFDDYILDNLQPVIEVSEWYYALQEEQKAEYECSIKLLSHNRYNCKRVMRVYHFDRKLNSADKRGKWFKFTHVFRNYGPGLRLIKFCDGGNNSIIMTGASVIMKAPPRQTVMN